MSTHTPTEIRRANRRLLITEIGGALAVIALAIGTVQGLQQIALLAAHAH